MLLMKKDAFDNESERKPSSEIVYVDPRSALRTSEWLSSAPDKYTKTMTTISLILSYSSLSISEDEAWPTGQRNDQINNISDLFDR